MKLVPFATFGKSDEPKGWTDALDAGVIEFTKSEILTPLGLNRWNLQDLKKRNSYYNRHAQYVPDQRLFDKGDCWRPFNEDDSEAVNYMKGDCEDFALTKWRRLFLMGYPPCLQIALCVHKKLGPHAVLIVRVEQDGKQGVLVLDNINRRVLPYQKTGLRFIAVSSPEGWQRVWA